MSQEERDRRIQDYYAKRFDEAERLITRSANGQLEYLRVQRLLSSRIAPGSRVLDVGGGTGVHAKWLAAAGHEVTLVDPVPEQVAVASAAGSGFRSLVGDARDLQFEDESFEVVLLFGPLYHLQGREERLRAWREAYRVLTPDGMVFAAGISRAAAALKMVLAHDFREIPSDALLTLLEHGSDDGQVPSGGFPGGHHHTAAELGEEARAAGFTDVTTVGIEGPAGLGLELFPPEHALVSAGNTIADATPADSRAVDLSPHLMSIARKPS